MAVSNKPNKCEAHNTGWSCLSVPSLAYDPLPAVGALTAAQQRFNYRLSKARVIIERAFGKLKSRWRLLKQLEGPTNRVPQTIITCGILHNICIHMDDQLDEDDDKDDDDDEVMTMVGMDI